MKVLFVVSGNSQYYEVAPFIRSQGDSLAEQGIEVSYFIIRGKGLLNYLKNIAPLRRYLTNSPPDVVHAHYALSGWVAVLAALGRWPVVLSYMGDDLFGSHTGPGKRTFKSWLLLWAGKLVQPLVSATICKSEQMAKATLNKKRCHIVPNGVRLEQFKMGDKKLRKELGLDQKVKYVLFLADPSDNNKNVTLVETALELLDQPDVDLLIRYKISHEAVAHYLNATDVFVLCSFSEGSPNVVKEAMACNCPMVVTNVGDAAWVVGNTPGCYVSPTFEAEDFAKKLHLALLFSEKNGRTKGRERLLALGLDAKTISQQLIGVYKKVLREKQKVNSS